MYHVGIKVETPGKMHEVQSKAMKRAEPSRTHYENMKESDET